MGGVWSAGWTDLIQPADQTPPTQSDKYQCRIDIVIFSWWRARGWLKYVDKKNKYIKQNCAPSWTYLRNYAGMEGKQNMKFVNLARDTNLSKKPAELLDSTSIWWNLLHQDTEMCFSYSRQDEFKGFYS